MIKAFKDMENNIIEKQEYKNFQMNIHVLFPVGFVSFSCLCPTKKSYFLQVSPTGLWGC